jgi:hypothetical protein
MSVQCERRYSRPLSSVQSREKLLDQAEVASDGELQAFRYAVLHLEDAKQGAERRRERSANVGEQICAEVAWQKSVLCVHRCQPRQSRRCARRIKVRAEQPKASSAQPNTVRRQSVVRRLGRKLGEKWINERDVEEKEVM